MKKWLLIPLSAALLPLVQADNTASVPVPVKGRIIEALEVSLVNTGITLPDLVAPATGEANATVELTCNSDGTSSITYGGKSNPYANGTASATTPSASSKNLTNSLGTSTGTCAQLTVTGRSGYYYIASTTPPSGLPAPVSAIVSCNTDQSGGGKIGTGGLYCGAKVTVTASAAGSASNYSTSGAGNAVVTVTYD